MTRTNGEIVRIEQHAERRMERTIPGEGGLQDERLEKPGGVREVPFDRARVGHRLQRAIFGRQRLREALGLRPYPLESLHERMRWLRPRVGPPAGCRRFS